MINIPARSPTPEEDVEVGIKLIDSNLPLRPGNVFQHPETHPLILDLVLLKKYGPEWLTWEPESLLIFIARDFGHPPSDASMSKIQAVKTLHVINTFWTDWTVFCWVAKALNGVPPDFTIMQVPTVAEAMFAVDVAERVREDVAYNQEINDYLENVHMWDGIFVPQEPLKFVTMDDIEDYPVDPTEIKLLWPAVRATNKPPQKESVTSEQLRRMLELKSSLDTQRAAMQRQLPLLNYVT